MACSFYFLHSVTVYFCEVRQHVKKTVDKKFNCSLPVHVGTIVLCNHVPFVHPRVLLVPPSAKCHPAGQVYVAMVPKVSHESVISAFEAGTTIFRHSVDTVTHEQTAVSVEAKANYLKQLKLRIC